MTGFRPFLNSDIPGLVAVWNSQPASPRRLAPLTATLFEQYVLAKPYFDPHGLIVAEEQGRIVGSVHAGFATGAPFGALETGAGVICQLLVEPQHSSRAAIARGLLTEGEHYLQSRGSQELYGGGVGWTAPFYLGLYGGCRLPGVMESEVLWTTTMQDAGYASSRTQTIWQRELTDFRAPVDRQNLQLRRQARLKPLTDTEILRWQEACAWCWTERERYAVVPSAGGPARGVLQFWNMEPLSHSWGTRAMGLIEVTMSDADGTASVCCFLGESLRAFQEQGVTVVEIQTADNDGILLDACRRLGFREVDRGVQFRKAC
ncbi:MAG: N-acetyltransferase family protein [Pirellulaceae bacterium]